MPDPRIVSAIAARIMAKTSVDGHTATAMVDDVTERGSDSPHAGVVSAAAYAIMQPVIDAFGKFFHQLAEAYRPVVAAISTAADIWIRAVNAAADEIGRSLASYADAVAETEAMRDWTPLD